METLKSFQICLAPSFSSSRIMKKKASLSPSQAGRSLSHSVESIVSIVNQVTLIDTEKAWKELELTGSLLEPELKTVRPLDLLNYDTQSVQSIPDHNIPYQIDESDTIVSYGL